MQSSGPPTPIGRRYASGLRQLQKLFANKARYHVHLDVALEFQPVEEALNARRGIFEGFMGGFLTFVDVLDNALHYVVWYNPEGSSGFVFKVHQQKVLLHFNSFKELCEKFISGAARRHLVLRGRRSNFDPNAEREKLCVASLCSCDLLFRQN